MGSEIKGLGDTLSELKFSIKRNFEKEEDSYENSQ
jgi:hypothetical protein